MNKLYRFKLDDDLNFSEDLSFKNVKVSSKIEQKSAMEKLRNKKETEQSVDKPRVENSVSDYLPLKQSKQNIDNPLKIEIKSKL